MEVIIGSLYRNNSELLAALAMLAPEGNVRVALVSLIDVVESAETDGEPTLWTRDALFEVIARSIVRLNLVVDDEEDGSDFDTDGLTPEQVIEKFRAELGLEGE